MIKIVNSGNGGVVGTKVINAETGAEIEFGVTGLSIDMLDVNDFVRATLKVALVNTEVTVGKAEWIAVNPSTGKFEPVASITYRDGSTVVIGEDGTPEIVPPPVSVAVVGSPVVQKFRGKSA